MAGLQDYTEALELAAEDVSFDSLVMAAMRKADTTNLSMLMALWPDLWAELDARYNAPGGAAGRRRAGDGMSVECTCPVCHTAAVDADYRRLADHIIDRANPPDDDMDECSLMIDAVDRLVDYILDQPCGCTPERVADQDPCPRCTAVGRLGDVDTRTVTS